MAPHVPHFSISLATSPRALSLPSSPLFTPASLPPCCYSLRHRRSFGHLPADIGTTAELPINNVLLNYRSGCATQVSFRRFRGLSSWEIKCNSKAFTGRFFYSLLTYVCKRREFLEACISFRTLFLEKFIETLTGTFLSSLHILRKFSSVKFSRCIAAIVFTEAIRSSKAPEVFGQRRMGHDRAWPI